MLSSTSKKVNARLYARVSTELQRDGASIDTQLVRMRAYCVMKDMNVIKEYVDIALSGKSEDREQFQLAINDCEPGECLVVMDLTRFSRRSKGGITLLEELHGKAVRLCSLEPDIDFGTPTGKAFFTIIMAFSQLEREVTAKKVSDTMQRLSHEDKLRSRAPFGWKFIGKDKDMVEDKEQQDVIRIIKKLKEKELSNKQISDYLNSKGYNKCINNNKKKPIEGIEFYPQKISVIYNGINDKRIKSFHKKDETKKQD